MFKNSDVKPFCLKANKLYIWLEQFHRKNFYSGKKEIDETTRTRLLVPTENATFEVVAVSQVFLIINIFFICEIGCDHIFKKTFKIIFILMR